jgi:hypothetical protein
VSIDWPSPQPHRVPPETVLTLLENNFLKSAKVIVFNNESYKTLLLSAPKNGIADVRTYDAVIDTAPKADLSIGFSMSITLHSATRARRLLAPTAAGLPSRSESHPMDHDSNSSGHTKTKDATAGTTHYLG